MGRPLIAVTSYPTNEMKRVELPVEYVDSLRRSGAQVVLWPPGDPDPVEMSERVDGVVLSGGGDLEPSTYGGEGHPSVYQTDPERDRSEIDLARHCVESGVPTFAICRGLQVLNVALGGTLHEHLPDVVGEAVRHRAPPREPIPHGVDVEASSLAAAVMGAQTVEPMSWHHQSVDRLGDGLSVVARAPDGVVEAVELVGHPFLLAVQWHPEITSATDPTQQRLFDAFVAFAGSRERPIRSGGASR